MAFVYQQDPFRSRIMYPGDSRRSANPVRAIAAYVNWQIVAGFVILIGFFVFTLLQGGDHWRVPGTVGLVIVGWVFSLCLHEFAHAATAYIGGDHSDSTASYLTFNPLKYLHPVLSILLPVVFMLLGGIGLPGGAVYLQPRLIRSRAWLSAVSAAGPLMNALVALICAIPFVVMPGFFFEHSALAAALALLAFFQVAAVVLNLLPIPPLDGYGILAPWLPRDIQQIAMSIANYGFILLFVLLWYVPFASHLYFSTVGNLLTVIHIDPYIALYFGLGTFQFWVR
jgi:Zn-dependent protease